MQAKPGVIDWLNTVLTNELTAINQYFLQAEMCEHWGYPRLYHQLRKLSIEEMKEAEEVLEHILYLGGVPNMQRLNQVRVGENVAEHLQLDLELELTQDQVLTDAIVHCAQVGDYTTRNLLEEKIREEKDHIDWLETQLETIQQIGLNTYLSQQIKDDDG
jgi:bacterioferritin